MHVVIVGGGIDGLATAWSLLKRGIQVTLLEQADVIPNPLSASGDQHRIIRRAYGGLGGYQSRIDEAYEAWNELWDDIGEKLLVDTGFLLVSQTPGDEAEVYHKGLLKAGYPIEDVPASRLETAYPFLDAGSDPAHRLQPGGRRAALRAHRRRDAGVAEARGRDDHDRREGRGDRRRQRQRLLLRRPLRPCRPDRGDGGCVGSRASAGTGDDPPAVPDRRRLPDTARGPEAGLGERARHSRRRAARSTAMCCRRSPEPA